MIIIDTFEQLRTEQAGLVTFGACFRFAARPTRAIPPDLYSAAPPRPWHGPSQYHHDAERRFTHEPWILVDNWTTGENRLGFVACVNLSDGALYHIPHDTMIIVLEQASVLTGAER
jgi:hypothetical protein